MINLESIMKECLARTSYRRECIRLQAAGLRFERAMKEYETSNRIYNRLTLSCACLLIAFALVGLTIVFL